MGEIISQLKGVLDGASKIGLGAAGVRQFADGLHEVEQVARQTADFLESVGVKEASEKDAEDLDELEARCGEQVTELEAECEAPAEKPKAKGKGKKKAADEEGASAEGILDDRPLMKLLLTQGVAFLVDLLKKKIGG